MMKAVRHYLLGLLASAWNGGIGAVAGILGIDTVAMTGATSEARILNGHEMLAAFGGAFVLHAVLWLRNHPLPESFETEPPFPPTDKTK